MYSSLIHPQRLLLLYNKLLIISKHVRSSPNFLFLLKNNFPGNFWTAKIWTQSSLCPPLVLDTLHYHFNSLHCRISYFLGSISCWGRRECLFVCLLPVWVEYIFQHIPNKGMHVKHFWRICICEYSLILSSFYLIAWQSIEH